MPGLLFLSTSLLVIATPGPDAALVTQLVLHTGARRQAAVAAVGMITAGALHGVLALTGVALLLRTDPRLLTALQWCGAVVMLVWGLRAVRAAARGPGAADVGAGPEAGTGPGAGAGAGGGPGCRSGAGPEAGPGHEAGLGSGAPGRGLGSASGLGSLSPAPPVAPAARRYFWTGMLCTGGNPKVGLFLLAYLPQFVPPGAPWALSMGVLTGVYLALAALWLTCVISAVHLLHGLARSRRRAPRVPGRGLRLVDGVVGVVFISFAIRLAWH
ncbi:LysE family translocator [Streptomyces benahoarensis]|uniref:LysE family translocator n=1 Tax=Streptomyces benahoarensis TaxID=2595054 RepID=UPI00163DBED6|nr:LysE family transporter [Streptomyces benahoarensis]